MAQIHVQIAGQTGPEGRAATVRISEGMSLEKVNAAVRAALRPLLDEEVGRTAISCSDGKV